MVTMFRPSNNFQFHVVPPAPLQRSAPGGWDPCPRNHGNNFPSLKVRTSTLPLIREDSATLEDFFPSEALVMTSVEMVDYAKVQCRINHPRMNIFSLCKA